MRRLTLFAAVGLTALAAAGAASAQSISVGQTVRGTIATSDPKVEVDGSHYDCWVFTAPAGTYTVDYRSDDFDAFLAVGKGRDCSGSTTVANDDWGDGLDSHAEFATDGGAWFIKANTLEGGETGAYTLSLVSGGDPRVMENDGFGPDDSEASDGEIDLAWLEALDGREGGEEHLMNVLCAAVDTLDLIVTMESMTEEQLEARVAEGSQFTDRAYATGGSLGFSRDDVETQVAELGVTLLMDPESSGDFSEARQECMGML
ncbi:MAG TPA: hypothetical protein VGR32_00030 [Brevundimonas sp.]|jgi:hypothetical protein|uniref:hypothetical protein n=1 Tax=Brevundimonas sp. TaxID=1871086 RepID=UPI002DF626E1|nr:hypothetical protein [Brevundimonas sp.]